METSNNKSNIEDKQAKSLMRQTKDQLVNIILRKDAIERELRESLKTSANKITDFSIENDNLKNKIDKLELKIDTLSQDYNNINNDFEEICDKLATERTEYHITLKHKNNWIWILTTLIIFDIIILLISFIG